MPTTVSLVGRWSTLVPLLVVDVFLLLVAVAKVVMRCLLRGHCPVCVICRWFERRKYRRLTNVNI